MNETTIDALIEELEAARKRLGGQARVRVAYQQHYPMRGVIARVTVPDREDVYGPGQDDDAQTCWLAVGDVGYAESPYGPAWAWTGRFPDLCPGCGEDADHDESECAPLVNGR